MSCAKLYLAWTEGSAETNTSGEVRSPLFPTPEKIHREAMEEFGRGETHIVKLGARM